MNGNDQRYLSNVERQQRRVEAVLAGKFTARTLPKAHNREELAAKMGLRKSDLDPYGRAQNVVKLADDAWSIYSKAREAATEIKQKKAAKPKTDKPKKKGAVARKAEAKKAAKK